MQEKLQRELSNRLTADNVAQYLLSADFYNLQELQKACRKFIMSDDDVYKAVRESDEWQKLSKECFMSFIDQMRQGS